MAERATPVGTLARSVRWLWMSPKRSQDELPALLAEQCDFLAASAERFDAGHEHEAKRLALSLRVLLYEKTDSPSLLGQLGVQDSLDFIDSDARRPPPLGKQVAYPVGWPLGFVGMSASTEGGGWSFFPMLGSDPELPSGRLAFAEWWEKRLLDRPGDPERWRRRDFILGAAHTEGGAHVDPRPPAWWTEIRDGTWMGAGVAVGPDGSPVPLANLAPAVIRQIAYEVLSTLEAAGLTSPPQPMSPQGPGALITSTSLEVPAARGSAEEPGS